MNPRLRRLLLLLVVALAAPRHASATPQPTPAPPKYHVYVNRAFTGTDGNLKMNDGSLHDVDTEAGYVCVTGQFDLPADSPIPPAEQGSMRREYYNLTEGKRYFATVHKNGTNECAVDTTPPPLFALPPNLTYAGPKQVDSQWVDEFNLTSFDWGSDFVFYFQYDQTTDTRFPALYILKDATGTLRYALRGMIPQPQTQYAGQMCTYPFVSAAACPKPMCLAQRQSNPGDVGNALGWVCGQPGVDCADINPGGSHYLPNDVYSHADWAFTQYWQLHAKEQGFGACCFGGNGNCVAGLSF